MYTNYRRSIVHPLTSRLQNGSFNDYLKILKKRKQSKTPFRFFHSSSLPKTIPIIRKSSKSTPAPQRALCSRSNAGFPSRNEVSSRESRSLDKTSLVVPVRHATSGQRGYRKVGKVESGVGGASGDKPIHDETQSKLCFLTLLPRV